MTADEALQTLAVAAVEYQKTRGRSAARGFDWWDAEVNPAKVAVLAAARTYARTQEQPHG